MRALILCLLLILAGCTSTRTVKTAWTPELDAREVDFAKALAHYGQGLMIEGDQQNSSLDALAQFSSAAELDSSSYRVQSRAALEALLQGKTDIAISGLKKFCNENSESFMACVDLARASEVAGMHNDALAAYRRAVNISPTNAFLYAAMAGIAFRDGDDKSALSFMDEGVRRSDNKKALLAICHNQGREFIVSDQLHRAIPVFEFMIKNSPPDSQQYNYLLGEIYRRLKDNKKAMQNYYLASKQTDPLPDSFIRLAVLQERSNIKNAIKTLERGKKLLPDDTLILLALARVYRDIGRVDDFVKNYDEIIRIVTEVRGEKLGPEFYLDYAATCNREGKENIAERVLKDCLLLYPESATVLNYIAYTWSEKDINLEQALVYAKRATEKEPDNGAFADTLGWVYYKLGEYKLAFKEISRAVVLMPDDPTVVEHLGDIYFSLNNIDKAVERWSSALLYSPDNSGLILKLTEQNVNIELLIEKSRKMMKKNRE